MVSVSDFHTIGGSFIPKTIIKMVKTASGWYTGIRVQVFDGAANYVKGRVVCGNFY